MISSREEKKQSAFFLPSSENSIEDSEPPGEALLEIQSDSKDKAPISLANESEAPLTSACEEKKSLLSGLVLPSRNLTQHLNYQKWYQLNATYGWNIPSLQQLFQLDAVYAKNLSEELDSIQAALANKYKDDLDYIQWHDFISLYRIVC